MRLPSTGDLLVERIIEILIRLYNKERFSKSELALEYGVSERTIQRDIMQRLGHLSIAKDKSGRYYIKDSKILKTYKNDYINLLKNIIGGGYLQLIL
ncbi:HTH domain-containing protein [Campylobacter sp. RM12647]|uniref:HTH domain-containing protein n=1 Tax=Campylobacter sp. RM12647 TaxID=2735737 RepID=UPI001D3BE47E|nr:HTH domain-containing protein [Campylobacter sp. RM12647]